jgi:hypothetical protein
MDDEDGTKKPKALPSPGAPEWIKRSESHSIQEYRWDMSDNAAKASIADSQSKAQVAIATYATPARQDTYRVGIVVGGVLLLGIGAMVGMAVEVVIAGMSVLAGVYVVPKAIEKWRQRTPEPPKAPPSRQIE